MSSEPANLRFKRYDSRTVSHDGVPALQLGFFYRILSPNESPGAIEGGLTPCLLQLTPSFGSNSFRILRGRVDVVFQRQRAGASSWVFDYFPQRKEELTESELEIGIGTDLNWIAAVHADLAYKTKLRKIRSVLTPGGKGTEHAWWIFERRNGQANLLGDSDLLLTVVVSEGVAMRGKVSMQGFLGWGRGTERLSFPFEIQTAVPVRVGRSISLQVTS